MSKIEEKCKEKGIFTSRQFKSVEKNIKWKTCIPSKNNEYKDQETKFNIYIAKLFENELKKTIKLCENILDTNASIIKGSVTRVNYANSRTTKLLTIISAIFLPLGFLFSLTSLPFDYIEKLKKRKNFELWFAITIFVLILITIYIFRKDLYNILFAKTIKNPEKKKLQKTKSKISPY